MGTTLRVCEKDQDEYDGEVLGNFYSKGRRDGEPVYGFAWNIKPEELDAFVGDKVIKELLETRIVQVDYDCIGRLA
jgi:hypothetical protein